MLPGMNKAALKDLQVNEKEFSRLEAMINSMTPTERLDPRIINSKRKLRIAKGSGTDVRDINNLLRQFDQAKKLMKKLTESHGNRFRHLPKRVMRGRR